MPNWCINTLTISSENSDDLKKFLFENKNGKDQLLDFNKVIMLPEEINYSKSNFTDNEKKILKQKYGADNWYDWQINNWGTKWNASNVDIIMDEKLYYNFDTAWSPPEPWFYKLVQKYPNIDMHLEYEEAGCDFAGYVSYSGGDLTEDTYELSVSIWNNCDKKFLNETINNEIKKYELGDERDDNIDNITDNVIDTLSDTMCNSSAIYDKVKELVENLI